MRYPQDETGRPYSADEHGKKTYMDGKVEPKPLVVEAPKHAAHDPKKGHK